MTKFCPIYRSFLSAMSSACADELRLSYLQLSVKTVAWGVYIGWKGGGIGCNYASATGAYILAEKYGSGLEISLRGSEISFKFLQTCTTRYLEMCELFKNVNHQYLLKHNY